MGFFDYIVLDPCLLNKVKPAWELHTILPEFPFAELLFHPNTWEKNGLEGERDNKQQDNGKTGSPSVPNLICSPSVTDTEYQPSSLTSLITMTNFHRL